MTRRTSNRRAGGALLSVIWLTAALTAIALSLASLVRVESERAGFSVDSLRARYLARGAIQRAMLYMEWGPNVRNPDGTPRYYQWGMPRLYFDFPAGVAEVRVLPEASKINVNVAPPETLYRLLLGLGAEPERAQEIAVGVVDWRSAGGAAFDQYYSSLSSSFSARHASLEEIEELLLVKGMTPELFYGSYQRESDGRLTPRPGLRDCVTVYGFTGGVDANAAEPAVLTAIGLSPQAAALIVAQRNSGPITREQLPALVQGEPAASRVQVGGGSIVTLRATAQLRLPNGGISPDRVSVQAVVKYVSGSAGRWQRFRTLRWYDQVWAQ